MYVLDHLLIKGLDISDLDNYLDAYLGIAKLQNGLSIFKID